MAAVILVAASCSFGGGTPAGVTVIQALDERGPATIGPSLLAGADVAELSALIKGGGGTCPDACWSRASDPEAAYIALVATGTCADRDLASSIAGSTLAITIRWRSKDCVGSAAPSTLPYSLFSVPRRSLPASPVRLTIRYSGQTVYLQPASGESVLDLRSAPDAASEQAAVAAAVAAADAAAGVTPGTRKLTALYRLHCLGGIDSYAVRLSPTAGGPAFVGQYVGGSPPRPEQGCPPP